eukprot:TRINITY_DN5847_c0_g3_i2.p1 TRINITY_DN5847_c0_g3~~TRINITY_DN5847_c0_g3_i2.p1  ORF type:complete len:366 (+),score=76.49 TRINITY_DN5847_c0_g3_i2:68-1099(+)
MAAALKRPPQQVLALAAKRRRVVLDDDCLGVVSGYLGGPAERLAAVASARRKRAFDQWIGESAADFARALQEQVSEQTGRDPAPAVFCKCYNPPRRLYRILSQSVRSFRMADRWTIGDGIMNITRLDEPWAEQLRAGGCAWARLAEYDVSSSSSADGDSAERLHFWLSTGLRKAPLLAHVNECYARAAQGSDSCTTAFRIVRVLCAVALHYTDYIWPLPSNFKRGDALCCLHPMKVPECDEGQTEHELLPGDRCEFLYTGNRGLGVLVRRTQSRKRVVTRYLRRRANVHMLFQVTAPLRTRLANAAICPDLLCERVCDFFEGHGLERISVERHERGFAVTSHW